MVTILINLGHVRETHPLDNLGGCGESSLKWLQTKELDIGDLVEKVHLEEVKRILDVD